MISCGDTFEAELSSLGYGGEAVYKEKGITLFVPGGLPGDRALLKIRKLKKNYGSASIEKVLEPSPHRVNPGCRAFEQGCGGCPWLPFDYSQQLFHKTKIVYETLEHIGRLNIKVSPAAGMNQPYVYRNKLSLHRDRKGRLGLYRENSREVVEFSTCRQAMAANVKVYMALKKINLPVAVTRVQLRCNQAGAVGLVFFSDAFSDSFYQLAGELHRQLPELAGVISKTTRGHTVLAGKSYLVQSVGKGAFSIPHTAFFQVNYRQAGVLLDLVRKWACTGRLQTLVDVYCGVGFFAISLAPDAGHVIGIENSKQAVTAARHNVNLNRLSNCRFIKQDVKQALAGLRLQRIDCMILDPPRAGCGKEVIREIIRLKPDRIIYVSCAPDTLARDLAWLVGGGYGISDCQPVDMFPHTYHIEVAVQLIGNQKAGNGLKK